MRNVHSRRRQQRNPGWRRTGGSPDEHTVSTFRTARYLMRQAFPPNRPDPSFSPAIVPDATFPRGNGRSPLPPPPQPPQTEVCSHQHNSEAQQCTFEFPTVAFWETDRLLPGGSRLRVLVSTGSEGFCAGPALSHHVVSCVAEASDTFSHPPQNLPARGPREWTERISVTRSTWAGNSVRPTGRLEVSSFTEGLSGVPLRGSPDLPQVRQLSQPQPYRRSGRAAALSWGGPLHGDIVGSIPG